MTILTNDKTTTTTNNKIQQQEDKGHSKHQNDKTHRKMWMKKLKLMQQTKRINGYKKETKTNREGVRKNGYF